MVRFIPIQQFEMKIAPRFVGEALEKLAGEAETKRGGHILLFLDGCKLLVGKLVQPAPDKEGPAAEVDNTTSKGFVHGDEGFALAGMRCAVSVKAGAVAANARFGAERFAEGLPERDAAIFDRVMGVHVEIAFAFEL